MRATGLESSFHYTYRREVYASGQEVFMTQRVARPMKFAAFISIIISVAVIFAACQGAVGKAGEKGEKGDPGDTTTGAPGFTALQLKGVGPFVLITDKAAAAIGDAETIDLSGYFRGGVAPIKISDPVPQFVQGSTTDTSDDITAKLDGTMLTLTPVAAGEYVINVFSVEITDAEDSNITLMVRARRNRVPTVPADSTDNQVVGTQAPAEAPEMTEAPAMTADCPAANECVVTLTFVDLDAGDAGEDKLIFAATSADTSKAEVVKVETDTTGLIARVFLKGIASTWVADTRTDTTQGDAMPGHKRVKISVTAMDADRQVAVDGDGDASEGVINIAVDGAPTAKTLPGGTLSQTASTYVIENVTGFFTNPEDQENGGETLTFSAKSSDENVVTVGFGANGDAATGTRLVVTRNAPGPATITVTATEVSGDSPPNQTGEGTFMVTVSN